MVGVVIMIIFLLNDYGEKSKYELLYTRAFNNLKEVKQSLIQWFDWYNQERSHQGLDNQTPNEVYYQYKTIHQAGWACLTHMSELNSTLRLYSSKEALH